VRMEGFPPLPILLFQGLAAARLLSGVGPLLPVSRRLFFWARARFLILLEDVSRGIE